MNMNDISMREGPNADIEFNLEITLEIAGAQQIFTVPVTSEQGEDGQFYLFGEMNVDIRNYGLTPPTKFLGTVKVSPYVVVAFKIGIELEA